MARMRSAAALEISDEARSPEAQPGGLLADFAYLREVIETNAIPEALRQQVIVEIAALASRYTLELANARSQPPAASPPPETPAPVPKPSSAPAPAERPNKAASVTSQPTDFLTPELASIIVQVRPRPGYIPDIFRYMGATAQMYKLLTADQEVTLAKAIEAGVFADEKLALAKARGEQLDPQLAADLRQLVRMGRTAKDHMIHANFRYVIKLVYARRGYDVSQEDLAQEGFLGLIRAVEKFDHRRGHKFSTYATAWLKQTMDRFHQEARTIHVPIHHQEAITKLRRIQTELQAELQKSPTIPEIAAAMNTNAERVHDLLEIQAQYLQPHPSLDAPVTEGEDSTLSDVVARREQPGESPETLRMREVMATVLTDQERQVFELSLGSYEHTAQEVAAQVGGGLKLSDVHRVRRTAQAKVAVEVGLDGLVANGYLSKKEQVVLELSYGRVAHTSQQIAALLGSDMTAKIVATIREQGVSKIGRLS